MIQSNKTKIKKLAKPSKAIRECLPKPQICRVLFWDHNSHDGWINEENYDIDPTLVVTIGFVVRETDSLLSIASTIDHNGNFCCIFNIIKTLIVEIQYYEHDAL